jgi:hypothetical protein
MNPDFLVSVQSSSLSPAPTNQQKTPPRMHTTKPTLRVIHAATQKVVASFCSSENEAQKYATMALDHELGRSRRGKMELERMGGKSTWEYAHRYFVILPEYGVWMNPNGGNNCPEGIEEDEREHPLIFATLNGQQYIGTYDSMDDMFISSTGRKFSPSNVSAYIIIPPLP